MFRMPLSIFTQDETFPFFIHFGEHTEPLYPHVHDYFELVIVTDGRATHIVDGQAYDIGKGAVFVIAYDTEHGYDNPEHFHICNVMFRAGFLELAGSDLAASPGYQALFVLEPQRSRDAHFTSRLRLSAAEFQEIRALLQVLHDEFYSKAPGWKTMVRAHFLHLVVALSRMYDTEQIPHSAGIVGLAPALAYIESHFQDPLAVESLAGMTHYSERQFLRLFKEATGQTPLQYITQLRMQNARQLLGSTQLSVTEIAGRCGFSDSNYFSKLFV
jgi:AraC family L-rhamnose operon transcriptional activator RhaR/AraC family L-rhamnose operon regulatory protein RhaS